MFETEYKDVQELEAADHCEGPSLMDRLETRIGDLLDEVGAWEVTDTKIRHNTGLSLWVAGGIEFFQVWEPREVKLTPSMKERLWPKVDRIIGGYANFKHKIDQKRIQEVLDKIAGNETAVEYPF